MGAQGKSHVKERERHSGQRGQTNAPKRGNKGGTPDTRAIHLHNFCAPQEGGKQIPTNNKPKTIKQIPAIYSFQNGRHEECNGPSRGRGLHGGNSPERGLLAHTNPPVIQEIPQISVETETIRDAGSSIWGGTGTTNFHKTDESSLNNIKETTDNNNSLSGRPPVDKQNKGGGNGSQGFSDLSTDKPGLHNKLGKVCHGTNTKDRVPGMILDSREMTISLPRGKILNLTRLCQDTLLRQEPHSLRDLARLVVKLYATLPTVSAAPLQLRYLQQDLIQAQQKGWNYESKLFFITRRQIGTVVVDRTLAPGKPRDGNIFRCIVSSRLGCSDGRGLLNRGCVDPSRKDYFSHKRVGITGSRDSHRNIP